MHPGLITRTLRQLLPAYSFLCEVLQARRVDRPPRRARICIVACSLLVLAAGCGGDSSPEDQVRAVIGALEGAAEARDVGGLMEHLSSDYRDAHGSGPGEASRYARGYFFAHQSIHLLTRVESIDFPSVDEARAKVLVGMVGRDAEAASAWDLAADLYEFDVTLVREGGNWKVTYAQWERP